MKIQRCPVRTAIRIKPVLVQDSSFFLPTQSAKCTLLSPNPASTVAKLNCVHLGLQEPLGGKVLFQCKLITTADTQSRCYTNSDRHQRPFLSGMPMEFSEMFNKKSKKLHCYLPYNWQFERIKSVWEVLNCQCQNNSH